MQSKTIVGRLRHRFATCTLVAHIASKRLVAPCVPRQHQSQGIIPRHNKQPRKPSLAPQRTVKIGGLDRPILVAGIRVGVASPSRLALHRTAMPTVKGFLALLLIGVGFAKILGNRDRCYKNIAPYKGLHRCYG